MAFGEIVCREQIGLPVILGLFALAHNGRSFVNEHRAFVAPVNHVERADVDFINAAQLLFNVTLQGATIFGIFVRFLIVPNGLAALTTISVLPPHEIRAVGE